MGTTLITGGSGFIGAEIARLLIEADDTGGGPVHVAQRSSELGRLADVADRIELHHLDLADAEEIERVVAAVRPERVFHFGAMLTGPGEQNPQALLETNAVGFIRFIEACRQAGTSQFIFASSIGTYGRDLDPDDPIDDWSLQRPTSVYGVTKVLGEHLGTYYKATYGLDFRSLRYPAIVGPGVTTWSLAQYTSWMIEGPAKGEPFAVWTGPDQVIALLWYQDAARAAIELAAAPLETIQTINYLVDGPRPTPSAGELADAVRRHLPDADITFEPDPASAPPRQVRIDDRAARREWGWAPRFDVDDMITAIIAAMAPPA